MPSDLPPLLMHFDPKGDLAEQARQCEAAAFDTRFDISRKQLDDAYVDFEDHSVFLTVSDHDGVVHAAARFILPGPAGFISLADMATHGWGVDGHVVARDAGLDLTTTWDVATFTRRPDTPGGNRLALALSHGLILAVRANELTSIVAILNERVRAYLAMHGLIYTTLPGAATLPYYGSPASTPVYARSVDFLATARRRNPEGYRLVGLGIGLDGIGIPALPDFVLSRTPRVIDLVATERPTSASPATGGPTVRRR